MFFSHITHSCLLMSEGKGENGQQTENLSQYLLLTLSSC